MTTEITSLLALPVETLAALGGGYSKQIRLSTKGMSDEEAQKAILDQLGGVSDELAKLVIGDRSIRVGETASQALSAMQAAMQTINTAFEGLGLSAASLIPHSAHPPELPNLAFRSLAPQRYDMSGYPDRCQT